MRSPGFTLIELLVALFITAIIFAMGYGTINQALNNRGAIEAQQARLLEVQKAMRILAQDFGQATPRPIREPVGDTWQPAFRAEAVEAQANSQQTLVTLTRSGWANPAGIQRPALQRVAYLADQGKLIREYWPVLDATLATLPAKRELLTKVHTISFRYMDFSFKWIKEWPVPAGNQQPMPGQPGPLTHLTLPLAVELTVELDDIGKLVRIFEVPQ